MEYYMWGALLPLPPQRRKTYSCVPIDPSGCAQRPIGAAALPSLRRKLEATSGVRDDHGWGGRQGLLRLYLSLRAEKAQRDPYQLLGQSPEVKRVLSSFLLEEESEAPIPS